MIVNLIHDLPQYSGVLRMIELKLLERRHEVIWTHTHQINERVDASIAVQDVPYRAPRRGNVKRFFINHGSSIIKEWGLNFDFDFFLAPSRYWIEGALARLKDNGQDYLVSPALGWPKVDSLLNLNDRHEEKIRIRKIFGLDESKPIICYYPTYIKPHRMTPKFWMRNYRIKDVVNILKTKTPNILVFPHQMDDSNEFDKLFPAQVFRAHNDCNQMLFTMADLIVSDCSGAAFESCVLDTPVVMIDNGFQWVVSDTKEPVNFSPRTGLGNLSENVNRFLQDPKWYSEEREQWRNKVFGPCDRLASERIVSYIENTVT